MHTCSGGYETPHSIDVQQSNLCRYRGPGCGVSRGAPCTIAGAQAAVYLTAPPAHLGKTAKLFCLNDFSHCFLGYLHLQLAGSTNGYQRLSLSPCFLPIYLLISFLQNLWLRLPEWVSTTYTGFLSICEVLGKLFIVTVISGPSSRYSSVDTMLKSSPLPNIHVLLIVGS